MGRQTKEGKAMTFRLRKELCDKIESYSEKTYLSKTAIIEKALTEYFEREDKKKES